MNGSYPVEHQAILGPDATTDIDFSSVSESVAVLSGTEHLMEQPIIAPVQSPLQQSASPP